MTQFLNGIGVIENTKLNWNVAILILSLIEFAIYRDSISFSIFLVALFSYQVWSLLIDKKKGMELRTADQTTAKIAELEDKINSLSLITALKGNYGNR